MLIFFSFIFSIKHFHHSHNSVSHTKGKINNSQGVHLFQSLNRSGVYLGPGGNLGACGDVLVMLIWARSKFLVDQSDCLVGTTCCIIWHECIGVLKDYNLLYNLTWVHWGTQRLQCWEAPHRETPGLQDKLPRGISGESGEEWEWGWCVASSGVHR